MSYNKLTQELKMYGMTTEDIREEYMNSITARLSGLEMVVMGLLFNHAQALDQSRKNMNIAKFILSEMMEAKRAVAA